MARNRKNWSVEPWDDSELLEFTQMIPETADTTTFTFRAPSGAWFDYEPGQFVTLDLPVPGGNVQRTYTLSSSPSRPMYISITAKAQPNSIATRWMMDNLKPGAKVKAYGPAGIFSLQRHPAKKYLFISAGSGITPMMSMTTWLWDLGQKPDVVFVHAARRPSDVIFKEHLYHMGNRESGLQLHIAVEEHDEFQSWYGYRGRISQLMLGLMAPDYLEREVFCCGPEPFMQAVRDILISLGFDMDRYHQESFGAPVETEAEVPDHDDTIPDEDATSELVFAASGISAPCNETDTVLTIAKANGLNIPSGCTFGLCGTCKTRKLEGEVHMVHNGGISDEDIEAGYILACCSNPIGKVVVDV